MNPAEMFKRLSLMSTNPFCSKFNAHLLIIEHALKNWDSLDDVSRTELISIIAELEKFSKDSNVSVGTIGIELTKKSLGLRYTQLMGFITSRKVYIDNLKSWAFEGEEFIKNDIYNKTGVRIHLSANFNDEEYEADVMQILDLDSDDMSADDKKDLVAKLDLLRRANTLPPEELTEVNGESR